MMSLTLDDTRKKLEKVGLRYSADNLSYLLEEAVRNDMSLQGFLDRILTEEIERREEERIRMWLKLSALPPGRTIETFDFSFQPTISQRKIETLATGEYLRRSENIIFLGPPGVGKTHLAAALGLKAIQCGYRVLFKRLDDLMRMLKEDEESPLSKRRRKRYYRSRLVIIDEVGFQPLCLKEANLFFRFISLHYEKSSLLITSNKAIRNWPEVFAGDEIIAVAILDRLLHHCHVINIKGRSWRLKEMEEALEGMGQGKQAHTEVDEAIFSPGQNVSQLRERIQKRPKSADDEVFL